MPISTMTSKGQLTIPKEVRDELRLHAGDRLEVTVEDGKVVMRPMTVGILDLIGILPRPERAMSVEEMNAAIAAAASASKNSDRS